MNKKEFKEELLELLQKKVISSGSELTYEEKIKEIKNNLFQYEKEIDYDMSNKGKEWTDDS